jgi:hypothetical protein
MHEIWEEHHRNIARIDRKFKKKCWAIFICGGIFIGFVVYLGFFYTFE